MEHQGAHGLPAREPIAAVKAEPERKKRNYQRSGFYTALREAKRVGIAKDRRRREVKATLAERASYRKHCGKSYDIGRRRAWAIVEAKQIIVNRVMPNISERRSLINKRTNRVMPLALDCMSLINALETAEKRAFDGLPATGARNTRSAFDSMAKRIRHTEKKQAATQQGGPASNDQRLGNGLPLATPDNAGAMQ